MVSLIQTKRVSDSPLAHRHPLHSGGFATLAKALCDQEAAKPHNHEQRRKQRREQEGPAQSDIDDNPSDMRSGGETKNEADSTEERESQGPSRFTVGCIGIIVDFFA